MACTLALLAVWAYIAYLSWPVLCLAHAQYGRGRAYRRLCNQLWRYHAAPQRPARGAHPCRLQWLVYRGAC